ncbi:MAG: tetratricopeptide repeat protein [Methanosarcina sp.]
MDFLYARAWYSKALALSNLKNEVGSEKNFEKALEAFDTLLEVNCQDSVAWQYKGSILSHLNRPEEALEAFEKALECDSANISALYLKGLTLSYLDMPENALKAFQSVLERDTENEGALYYSGLILNRFSRVEEALEAFTKTTELNPENFRALYNRGVNLSISGRNEEALEVFGKTLILEPLYAEAWKGEAKAFFSLGRKKEALKSCKKALELDPACASTWETQAIVLKSMGRKEEALGAFERSLILQPANAKNQAEKGKILGSLGRYKEALKAFDGALQLDDILTEAKIGKGRALLALGHVQEAFTCFRKVVETDSESSEGWGGIGSCLLALERYYEALQAYEKASSLGSEDCYTLNGLGEVYYKLEAYSDALETFERILFLDPENPFAWNGKGNVLYKLGKYRDALEAYENLLTLDYESVPARYNKGIALSRLKARNKNIFEESLENQRQTAFKKYLELSGKYSEEEFDAKGWIYRGFAFAELGQYREALKAFENGLKTEEENPFPKIYKGLTLICLGKYEKALEIFEGIEKTFEAISLIEEPNFEKNQINSEKERKEEYKERSELRSEFLTSSEGKSWLEIFRIAKGFTLDALDRYEDALLAFEEAEEILERGKIAAFGKGLLFVHCREWEKALRIFDRILFSNPEDQQALVIKSYVLIQLQDFEKAAGILKSLSDERMKNENTPLISGISLDLPYCLSGFAYSELGDFKEALMAYKKALEVNPKNIHARNGLAELYFRLGNNKGALKELEASIIEAPDDVFSRNLKGRIDLEEQAYEDALEDFRRALALNPEDRRLLLWDSFARYMYAEAFFGEENASFRHILLAAAGKLEKANLDFISENAKFKNPRSNNLKSESSNSEDFELKNSRFGNSELETLELKGLELKDLQFKSLEFKSSELEKLESGSPALKGLKKKTFKHEINLENSKSENKELRACTLYLLGFFYYRARYFQKSAQTLEECVNLKASMYAEKSAAVLLDRIHSGPLRPSWWEWWLYSEPYGLLKKIGFGTIFLFIFSLLLAHPAASTLPLISGVSFYANQILNQLALITGSGSISWPLYGREYAVFILALFSILLIPEFGPRKRQKEEFQFEMPLLPALNFEVPVSLLDEFTKELQRSLFFPEPMEESIVNYGNF